ncbi:potassium channel subfamily K member 6 isoform X1 [Tribolium castaneum]|uniref:Potassium channel subfamily K member 1-like Protein n=1 Tax=Tribolium castaneum TaxID=7070 RepID=D6WAV5_TRICA|nr:PREDICTED: potassium channel subfamily K member 6 isoform X1 [Tribolium castaneum]EEZ97944.1 Potassium channel subfamily K member 1-like Protein [Tribolium castaneum]|eukprot:XP_008201687.1 PREDICTED: potassium channel subfamily K member 6 isoform X1 [Tribolium castaneum]
MEFRNYGTYESVLRGKEEHVPLLPRKISRQYKGTRLMGMCRTSFFFSIYLIIYVMFLFSGAAVFSVLETPPERAARARLDGVVLKFRSENPTVTDQALEDLITEVVKASNRGVSASRNASGEPNWSFGQSLFFSSTVVTTIGYGHVTPLSRTGKIFCMLYAMVGIPLTLVLLSALVERLLVPTIWLLQWLNSRLGHLYQPFNIRILHLFIIVLILIVLFLLAPAAVFASIEPEWDYLDSLYYCFISLTTIGLGDYIPGDSPDQPYRPLYKIATTGYLFMGITFMMLTLAVFYDIPQLNLGLLFTSHEETNMEKVRLAGAGMGLQYGGAAYSPGDDNTHRQVVRVRSRRDDSPSPDEAPQKDFQLP